MEVEPPSTGEGVVDYEMIQEDGTSSPSTAAMDDAQMQMVYDAMPTSSSVGAAEPDEDIQEYNEEVVMQEEEEGGRGGFNGEVDYREDVAHTVHHALPGAGEERAMVDNEPVVAAKVEPVVSKEIDVSIQGQLTGIGEDAIRDKSANVAEPNGGEVQEQGAQGSSEADDAQYEGEDQNEQENSSGYQEEETLQGVKEDGEVQDLRSRGLEEEGAEEEDSAEVHDNYREEEESGTVYQVEDHEERQEGDEEEEAEGEDEDGAEKEEQGDQGENEPYSEEKGGLHSASHHAETSSKLGDVHQLAEHEPAQESKGTLSEREKEDSDVRPPSLRVTFNDQDFSIWNADSVATETQGICPPLAIEHDIFHAPLEALFEAMRVKHALGDFLEEGAELVLSFANLELTVREDDYYARDVTLEDIHRLHLGLIGHEADLHVVVSEAPRFISRYNDLAAQLIAHTEDSSELKGDGEEPVDPSTQEEGDQTLTADVEEVEAINEEGQKEGEEEVTDDVEKLQALKEDPRTTQIRIEKEEEVTQIDQNEEVEEEEEDEKEEEKEEEEAEETDRGKEIVQEEIGEEGEEERERFEEEQQYEDNGQNEDEEGNAVDDANVIGSPVSQVPEQGAADAEEHYVDYEDVVDPDPDQGDESQGQAHHDNGDVPEPVELSGDQEERASEILEEGKEKSNGMDVSQSEIETASGQKRAYEEGDEDYEEDLPASPSAIEGKRARVE